jgi:hypothetical protein
VKNGNFRVAKFGTQIPENTQGSKAPRRKAASEHKGSSSMADSIFPLEIMATLSLDFGTFNSIGLRVRHTPARG